jgi:hypothetical protein
MSDLSRQLVESAHYLESTGMSKQQLSALHHFSRQGRQVGFRQTYAYFGESKRLRQNNANFAERLKFVAVEHRRGRQGFGALIQQALKRWPL